MRGANARRAVFDARRLYRTHAFLYAYAWFIFDDLVWFAASAVWEGRLGRVA